MMYILAIPATAIAICAAMGPWLIKELHKFKFGQSIRDEGPKHHQVKSGTPTMGGIMMLIAIFVAVLLWVPLTPDVIIALVLTLGHGIIGFLDDYIKIAKKRNLGLTAKQKFLCQFILAGAFCLFAELYLKNTRLWIPGVNAVIELGYAYYLLAFILLVGTTNAVNLTDGLDGLVSFISLPVMAAYALIAVTCGVVGSPGLAGFAMAVFGACAGFLIFNHHPAKVFMGDTGSLALGGAVAALALLTKSELLLVVIGGIYVAEALSVIMQVSYFKYTHGKRIFRMSPIHHHFELGGWGETKVVFVFSMVSCFLSLLGVALWLIR